MFKRIWGLKKRGPKTGGREGSLGLGGKSMRRGVRKEKCLFELTLKVFISESRL